MLAPGASWRYPTVLLRGCVRPALAELAPGVDSVRATFLYKGRVAESNAVLAQWPARGKPVVRRELKTTDTVGGKPVQDSNWGCRGERVNTLEPGTYTVRATFEYDHHLYESNKVTIVWPGRPKP